MLVGSVLLKKPENLLLWLFALVLCNARVISSVGKKTIQPSAKVLCFIIIALGATPNPWPIVAALPVPVQPTIENPASVEADTELVMLPLEFDDAEPPANQFHAT